MSLSAARTLARKLARTYCQIICPQLLVTFGGLTMRILHVLTYYRPHISGLTIYVERLSRGLARAGHQVTVLTSQYDRGLACDETMDGVTIVRVPVLARVSKGVIMPTFGVKLRRLLPRFDLVHLHLPQFDGAGIAINESYELDAVGAEKQDKKFGSYYFAIGVGYSFIPMTKLFAEYVYNYSKQENDTTIQSNAFHIGAMLSI